MGEPRHDLAGSGPGEERQVQIQQVVVHGLPQVSRDPLLHPSYEVVPGEVHHVLERDDHQNEQDDPADRGLGISIQIHDAPCRELQSPGQATGRAPSSRRAEYGFQERNEEHEGKRVQRSKQRSREGPQQEDREVGPQEAQDPPVGRHRLDGAWTGPARSKGVRPRCSDPGQARVRRRPTLRAPEQARTRHYRGRGFRVAMGTIISSGEIPPWRNELR